MAEQQEEAEGVYVEHQYMCSECHQLFNSLEDVLIHQQIHTGQEGEGEVEAVTVQDVPEMGQSQQYQCLECGTLLVEPEELLQHQEMHMREMLEPVQYQCLDCLALFDSPETWLEHRAKLGVLENGVQRIELRLVPGTQEDSQQQHQQQAEVVVIHPYECSECSLLFQTPEDFLQHQGEHFLCQDKESGEPGVMSGFEEVRGRDEPTERVENIRIRVAEKKVAFCAKPQQCELCHRTFTSINRLAAHKRVHEQGTYECPECGKVFKKLTSLQTHLRTHSGVARYLCVDCGNGFTTEMTLIMHRKTHTAEPFHKCQFCNKTFTNMTKYLYHRRTHLDRDLSAAPARPEKRTPPTLMQHRANQGPFSCRLCPKTFLSQLQLVHHRRKSHATERKFMCGICGKSFKKHIHVRNHIRTHTGERPFQCSDCGKTFSSLANLMRHNLIHSGVRPYRCDVCHRSFSQASNLRQHSLLHSKAEALSCPDCNATFRWPTKLAAHRFIKHPGSPAPFPCHHCEAQGTPTIMCNEFGEAIAIISTSEGEELPLEQALEIYHTALENSLAVDGLHLL
uniref:C2H2-type domain-containing protein n=1 Tax=Mola mola TaxID=94237 RepID=A0A3Q3X5T1_MOLML